MANKGITFKLEGMKEVKDLLQGLPASVGDKVQADLNTKAAKIVQDELKASAPDGDSTKKPKNQIVNNIVVKNIPGSKSAKTIGFTNRVFYVRFLEFGTKVRQITGKFRKGANRGSMNAEPFIRKAHEAATPKVIEFLKANYQKIVIASIRKQAKKFKK